MKYNNKSLDHEEDVITYIQRLIQQEYEWINPYEKPSEFTPDSNATSHKEFFY